MSDRSRRFARGLAASLSWLAAAFSFVGACIAFALNSIAGVVAGVLLCAVFFIAGNRLEQRHPRREVDDASRDFFARRPEGLSKTPSWIPYSAYWFIGFALAVLTPESTVAHSPFIQATLSTLGEWIPAMHRYARLSSHPDLIRFWLGAMWLLMPVFTVYYIMTPWGRPQTFALQTMTLRQFLIVFAFVPATCFLMLMESLWFYENPVPVQYGDTGGRAGAMTAWALDSRLGLAIMGSTLFWAQAVWFGSGLRTIWRTLRASGRQLVER